MTTVNPVSSAVSPEDQPTRPGAPFSLPMSQEALESLPFPISIYTCDGLLVGANNLVEQLFRVPQSAVLGTFNILTDPIAQAGNTHELFQAAIAGQRVQAPPICYDYSFPATRNPTRTNCWIELTYLPFRDAAGCVTHVGAITQDVTDRVEAEQKMALLTALIENASDGIAVTDLTGRFTYCNPAYQALIGYGDDAIGMSIADVHPDEAAAMADGTTQVREHGYWHGQLTARRADGSSFPSEISAFTLRDHDGQPNGMGAIIRDLSERQAQEQRLRMFETLVENAAIGMAITDLEGNYTYANKALRATYGYGDAMIGMSIPQLLPPEEQANVGPKLAELFTNGHMNTESQFLCRDGSSRPTAVAAMLIGNANGVPLATAAVIRDLTEERAREGDLRTFKALVENAPDAISVVSAEQGIFIYNNAAFERIFGYGDEVLNLPVTTIYLEENIKYFPELLQELVVNGKIQGTMTFRRKDGSALPASYAIFAVYDSNGNPQSFVSIIRDITEQQHAEAERVILQEQVIAAQQAALRELSTPLIPIADGVVAMPLIGSIDSSRAQMVIEALLTGVSELRASTTIIDITGVPVVDTQVANALLRAAQAVKLLGARVILTGIRPEVAQTLVGLGVDLGGITTRGTLQAGIAEALERRAN